MRRQVLNQISAMKNSPSSKLAKLVVLLWVVLSGAGISAAPIVLTNATATYSQPPVGGFHAFSADQAIDGIINNDNGWGAYPQVGGIAQTAVFQTVTDVGFTGGTKLKFETIHQIASLSHGLGRFRLSVTTDNRSSYADRRMTNGNVTANWVVLTPLSYVSQGGATMQLLQDGSILVSGNNPPTDRYTIIAQTTLTNITGVRLEVLPHASLPFGGPGRATDGNFILTEFTMDAAPISPTIPTTAKLEVSEYSVRFSTVTDQTYQVQFAQSADGPWTNLGGPIAGTGLDIVVPDRQVQGQAKLYRVIVVP
jgi:hypothetical protein